MKAITLTQPWATLVALGAKRIETRSWRTDYIGPLAIHAAKGFPEAAKVACYGTPFLAALGAAGLRGPSDLPLGAVVAICRLRGCYRTPPDGVEWREYASGLRLPPDEPERAFGDYAPGRFAWLLTGVVALPEPVPARGALGLWEWDAPDEVAALLAGGAR